MHLETSRRLWSARRAQNYSYVRAREQSDTEVEFTLVVVQQGRVIERALLRQDPGLSGLGKRWTGRDGGVPRLLWRERGVQIGTHEAGAPALTVDELYDVCGRDVLGSHDELVPRLYFQLNGLLQHCGFLVDDCPRCPVASLQSVGTSTPKIWQEPTDILCTDQHGLFVAEDEPHRTASCESCRCRARNRDDPRVRMRAPAPLRPPSTDELCSLLPETCAEGASPPPLGDICQIDPAACPRRDGKQPAMGTWECWHLLTFDCGPP